MKSSLFIACSATGFGGAVYAELNCQSCVVSLCSFIFSKANHGGGLMALYGPTSSTSSSCFISCYAEFAGGGMYHEGYDSDNIHLTNSLFTNNRADSTDQRGGGGFEDFKYYTYLSHYSFCFFSGNIAQTGVGYDISVYRDALNENDIFHCFTTAKDNSFWNAYQYQNEWLHLTCINEKLSPVKNENRHHAISAFQA